MRHVDGRSQAMMVALTYCGLASSLLFAFAGYSRFSGLQYHIGYDIRPLGFFILSSSVDPLVWLSSTATTAASGLVIAFRQIGRERLVYILFVLSEAIQLTLFLSGQQFAAFQLSLATGVVLVCLAVVLPKRLRSVTQSEGALLTCAGFLALAVLVESLALFSRVLSTLQESFLEIPSSFLQAVTVQTQLSDSLFVTSPALMLIMLFSWVPLLPFLLRRKCTGFEPSTSSRRERIGTEMISSFALLGIAIVVGVFVTISPYLTRGGFLGIDTPYYYGRLASMKTFGDVAYIFGLDSHPLYLVLLYFIRMTTGWDNIQVIIAGPGLLAALFALANYLLAKEVTASHLASGIAALFAASWLHTTVGLFAGIYANWLAMTFVVFFLFCFVTTLRDGGKLSVIGTIAFAYMTALSHIWTWAVLIASLWMGSLLLVLDHLRKSKTQRDHKPFKLLAILVVVTSPPLVLSLVLPGFNSFLFSPGDTVYGIIAAMRLDRINQAWFLISFTLTKYVGGLLTYPLAIILAFAGAIFVVKSSPGISRLLIGWLVVTSISALVLDSWYQWRALYVIPFEIFAASAMMGILDTLDRIGKKDRVSTGSSFFLGKCLKGLFVVLMILDSVNYAMMAAANLPAS